MQAIKDISNAIKWYKEHGINLIPIKKETKQPALTEWKRYQTEKYPYDKIENHIMKGGNVAAVCGTISNGLTVVDLDSPALYEIFKDIQTYTVRTPNGGYHLYFFIEVYINKVGKYADLPIDIQGEGSIVLCVPSKGYTVVKDCDIMRIESIDTILERVPKNEKREKDLSSEIKRIKDENNLTDICLRYGLMKELEIRNGWQALCPFHKETTASFTVFDTNTFYCFGCKEHGDIFDFVQKMDGIDFKAAFKKLGGKISNKKDTKTAKVEAVDIANKINEMCILKTTTDTKEIYRYDNGIYTKKNVEAGLQVMAAKMKEDLTPHIFKNIIFTLHGLTYINRERFNANKNLIFLKNCIYDTDTDTIKEFNPDILSTVRLPITYDKEADCPAIHKFLSEILEVEDIEVIQEYFGYCLLKDYRFAKALLLQGKGSNGKSVLIGLFRAFIGAENSSSLSLHELEDKFTVAELYGKSLNVCADLEYEELKKTGTWKKATGNDTITAQFKFCKPFDFVNFAKFIFSANILPVTKDTTHAFFRRWILISFNKVFNSNTADSRLLEKLTTEQELSGLFNFAVIGLKRLLANKRFTYNESKIKDEYERLSKSFYAFADDCFIEDSEGFLTTNEIMKAYNTYCKEHRLPMMDRGKCIELLKSGYDVGSYRKQTDGLRQYGWVGMSLKQKETQKTIQNELCEKTQTTEPKKDPKKDLADKTREWLEHYTK